MSQRRPLDVIEVKKPCPADWNRMQGDATKRFCSHCGKFVHNLSEMPADEAERLVCASAGNLCVRFARDAASGRVITLNYASKAKYSRRRAIGTVASIVAAVCAAGGWAAVKFLRKSDPPSRMMIMGDIALPPVNPPQQK
jgi:hypothetical protein